MFLPPDDLRELLADVVDRDPWLADAVVRFEEKVERANQLIDDGHLRAAQCWLANALRLRSLAITRAHRLRAEATVDEALTAARDAAKEK